MKTYDEFMKKAHGALILERENEIILELRATRDYLSDKIETLSIEHRGDIVELEKKVNNRFDTLESKIDKLIEAVKR